jgi:pyruvate dehydrogenase E2 component (dihydrolipoamide acetyltransferase)
MLGMAYEAVPVTGMRKTIAARLSESKQTVPHFYLTVDCRIDALLDARKQMNDAANGKYKLSVNDFVIKAVAAALMRVPAANMAWSDTEMLQYKNADISVAVATPTGLITPIIKAAEGKGMAAISLEMKDLAARARDGKLKPSEYQGGTFSISNLGMYGIKDFAAIINPPQGCILAVGAGVEQPVVENGQIVVGTVMSVTLSVDHRVVDGAVGAEFLKAFKECIENPVLMLA